MFFFSHKFSLNVSNGRLHKDTAPVSSVYVVLTPYGLPFTFELCNFWPTAQYNSEV